MMININSMGVLEIKGRPVISTFWILIFVGAFTSLVSAFLIVRGDWYIAMAIIFAVPGMVILFKYPLFGVFLWLGAAQFLMVADSNQIRRVYWIIHRFVPLLCLGLILIRRFFLSDKRRLPKLGLSEFALLGYIIASIISIVFSHEDSIAILILFFDRIYISLCLYMVVYLSVPRLQDYRILIFIVLFIAVSQSIIGILSWVAPQALPDIWLTWVGSRTIGSLSNPSVYTAALLFAGLILFQAGRTVSSKRMRFTYLSAFILTVLCVFLSLSRASWLGGLLVGFGLMFIYPRFMFRFGLIVVVLAILLGSFLLLGDSSLIQDRFYSEQSEQSALSRLPVTLASIKMFATKPVFGWGYGNFDLYDRQFYDNTVGSFTADNKDHSSHNYFLTLLAEQGIVGFTLYMLPLFILLIRSIKEYTSMPDQGLLNKKFLVILWLVIVNLIVLNNFINLKVVYGVGLWWITLGLIAGLLHLFRFNGIPERDSNLQL